MAYRNPKTSSWFLQVILIGYWFLYFKIREDPIHIVVGSDELAVNRMIKQNIEVVDERMKKPRLVKLLQTIMDGSKMIIFCQTKRGCDYLARALSMENWPAVAIHGDKTQQERDYVMMQFKTGKYPILVATDLAARGLGNHFIIK